jgi:hypothetical protein
MKRTKAFDPEKARTLLAFIRQGGFPGVAADAAGVPYRIFRGWVRRGEGPGAREPWRGFVRDLRQAIAQARLLSELAVCKKDPKFWLSHGPGRETAELVGWTQPVRAQPKQRNAGDPLEACRALCSWVMDALAPYPEARVKLAEQMAANPPPGEQDKKGASPSVFGVGGAGPFSWGACDPSLN